MRSLTTITKAAPSEVCELLPAVTEPPSAKTGRSLAKASGFVPRRTPSSVSMMCWRSWRFSLSSRYTSLTVMGAMPDAKAPLSMAAAARAWLSTAKASWSSREMLNSLATASAVNPMPQYHSGLFLATRALGTMRHPPKGMGVMVSMPPAMMQSAMPAWILAEAMAMVSRPLAQ